METLQFDGSPYLSYIIESEVLGWEWTWAVSSKYTAKPQVPSISLPLFTEL